MFCVIVQYCANPQCSRVLTVFLMLHIRCNIHPLVDQPNIYFDLLCISYMVHSVSLFYTFFFADVVTCTDFKKDK